MPPADEHSRCRPTHRTAYAFGSSSGRSAFSFVSRIGARQGTASTIAEVPSISEPGKAEASAKVENRWSKTDFLMKLQSLMRPVQYRGQSY
jgi:hypothetical protein